MKIVIILLILLSIPLVYASTIHGTIYGLSLKPVKDVIVEVDSQPPQKLVSRDGTYSFSLEKGSYTIKAETISAEKSIVEERITIVEDNGNYVLDLFILPEQTEQKPENSSILWYIIPAIIIGILILFMLKRRKPKIEAKEKEPERTDLDNLIKIIKDNDGRITQKELRKHFPLSEAKVSLMITELESKGKIEKIKKGRGNIIILK